ncbi:MAG: stage II sporulation protein R [Clostridia bacterium]|nr:stage II sporulation protein R [Clostridia bacterium]
MKFKSVYLLILLTLCTGFWIFKSESAVNDISQNIVRLHIIANSNSEEDQKIKYAVRDNLLENVRNKNESDNYKYFVSNLNEAELIADNVISEYGCNYTSKAVMGKFYFPTKKYENIILPAGEYEAVRIVLGDGKGENWWCVMYPPLCFNNKTYGELGEKEIEQLKKAMTEESFELINTDDEKITIKPAFKLVELWQNLKNKIKN